MQAVLDAIERYHREKFLDDVNAAYVRLKQNAKGWKEERAERALWDRALGDGMSFIKCDGIRTVSKERL